MLSTLEIESGLNLLHAKHAIFALSAGCDLGDSAIAGADADANAMTDD